MALRKRPGFPPLYLTDEDGCAHPGRNLRQRKYLPGRGALVECRERGCGLFFLIGYDGRLRQVTHDGREYRADVNEVAHTGNDEEAA